MKEFTVQLDPVRSFEVVVMHEELFSVDRDRGVVEESRQHGVSQESAHRQVRDRKDEHDPGGAA